MKKLIMLCAVVFMFGSVMPIKAEENLNEDDGYKKYIENSARDKADIFCEALYQGKIGMAKYLIDQGIDTKNSLLCVLSDEIIPSNEIVEELVNIVIDNGADVNAKDKFGRTPLLFASRNRMKNVANVLLSKGAVIDNIEIAAYLGDINFVKKFLSQGNNIEEKYGYRGNTLLHYAAQEGNIKLAKFLLSKGASVNAKNERRSEAPLVTAVIYNQKKMIKFLILKGAEINSKDYDNATPLDNARTEEIKQLLIANGAKSGKDLK